jgi:hypothetical protein
MKLGLLLAAMTLPLPAALRAHKDVTVSERSFECIHHGTKIRNTQPTAALGRFCGNGGGNAT